METKIVLLSTIEKVFIINYAQKNKNVPLNNKAWFNLHMATHCKE